MPADQDPSPAASSWRSPWRRLTPLAGLLALLVAAYAAGWHRELSFETLLRHYAAIEAFVATHRAAAVLAFIAIYVVGAVLAMPAGVVLAVVGGFLFGALVGGASAMVGSTIGATVVFLLARSALGEHLLRRVGPLAMRFAAGFRADAFFYLLFLRLIPVPSWLTNFTAALFGVRLPVFVSATALGRVPGSFALALLGAGLDGVIAAQEAAYRACLAAGGPDCRVDFDAAAVVTPTLIVALLALGLLALTPVVARRLLMRSPEH